MSEYRKGETSDDLGDLVNRATMAAELGDPDANARLMDKTINRIVEAAGVAIILTVFCLVLGNALGRYLFNVPIPWSEEIVVALMPWLAMSGVFLSVRRRELIRIGYFVSKLNPRLESIFSSLGGLISAALFVFLAFHSFRYLFLFGSDPTVYLRIPTGWFTSAFAVGGAIVAIAFLVSVVKPSR